MANIPDIHIRLDEEELREQVRSSVGQALVDVSLRFRAAADALNPEWWNAQEEWIEDEIKRRVEEEREKWTTDQTS